jgi:hypothetical protein
MTNYEVGYCRPPRYAQWKKGQSGNPAGRPRRPATVSALVANLLGQRVVVRKGKTTKRTTRLEHLLHKLFEQAIAGDPRLMKMALDEARKHETRARDDTSAGSTDSAADAEVAQALYERLMRDAVRRAADETGSGTA